MWEKIVLNLLSNAFKFTLRRRDRGRAAAASADRRCVELTVQRYAASAFRPIELPRLFERFHRVEGQKSRSFEGSGIGLALVQELVQAAWRHDPRRERARSRARRSRSRIPFGTDPSAARIRSAAERVARLDVAARRGAYVEEALRWLPATSQPTALPNSTDAPSDRAGLLRQGADSGAHPGRRRQCRHARLCRAACSERAGTWRRCRRSGGARSDPDATSPICC